MQENCIFRSRLLEANAGTSACLRPDHPAHGMEISLRLGEVNGEIESLADFHRARGLERHSVFAKVNDLVQIENDSRGIAIHAGERRTLCRMPNMLASLSAGTWQIPMERERSP